jgi:hypothetical protein
LVALTVTDDKRNTWWLLPLTLVLLPFVLAAEALRLAIALVLLLVVWVTWCPRRKYAIVVYSNSPVWREYFETNVVPQLGDRAVVLNWSERKRWPPTLSVFLFRSFSGSREFNPIAIVFEPWVWPRRFRFYRAFRSFKHGRAEDVDNLRLEFFDLLDELAPPNAT